MTPSREKLIYFEKVLESMEEKGSNLEDLDLHGQYSFKSEEMIKRMEIMGRVKSIESLRFDVSSDLKDILNWSLRSGKSLEKLIIEGNHYCSVIQIEIVLEILKNLENLKSITLPSNIFDDWSRKFKNLPVNLREINVKYVYHPSESDFNMFAHDVWLAAITQFDFRYIATNDECYASHVIEFFEELSNMTSLEYLNIKIDMNVFDEEIKKVNEKSDFKNAFEKLSNLKIVEFDFSELENERIIELKCFDKFQNIEYISLNGKIKKFKNFEVTARLPYFTDFRTSSTNPLKILDRTNVIEATGIEAIERAIETNFENPIGVLLNSIPTISDAFNRGFRRWFKS